MLLGLISATGGTGTVLGESINEPEKYLPRVGAMIEGPAFYPALSAKENLNVLATLGHFPKKRVDELLELVGLADRAGSKFKTYSLGMKQRLGIAAALLPNPELLILDEPTNGLDPEGIQEIRELMQSLAQEGTTVFVSSHLLSELEMISEHLVMLRKGKVLFTGRLAELLAAQQPIVIAVPENVSDLGKVSEIANRMGHQAQIVASEVRIVGENDFTADLNRAVFAEGITLSTLLAQLPSLEETFFDMTGEQA
jgi:ABC-2 type transport system ATP-binding protein